MDLVSDTESLDAHEMAQSAATPSSEGEESRSQNAEEPPTPAPSVKRGRPKGSKDAQPRTRKPTHTPSKQYVDAHDDTVHHDPNSAALPSLRYFEEAMEHARQQEMTRRISLYTSWLPY